MAKVTIKIPGVSWRDGRPRYNPGPKQRKLGYKGEDLRHGADGPWLSLHEAAAWAEQRAAAVADRREAKAAGKKLGKVRVARHQTMQGLADEWFESPKFKGGLNRGKRAEEGLSPTTTADYKGKLASLWKYDPELAETPPPAISPPIAQAIFDRLWEDRGLAAARSATAVLSSMWKWAKSRGRGGITLNPWIGMEKPMLQPRLCVWEDHEVAAFIATADVIGRPEMGDAVFFGLFTGQRQNDRLLYEKAGRDDAGRLVFRQSKTSAIVAIPATPQLAGRLDAAERRRFSLVITGPRELAQGELREEADARARRLVIVDETAGRPFKRDWYKHVFMDVREKVARGLVHAPDGTQQSGLAMPKHPKDRRLTVAEVVAHYEREMAAAGDREWILLPMPQILHRRDQDLRDTAVTWLARAGCNELQIASITGHSLASIHQVLKHYLALHPEMADAAIGKMVEWMEKRGSVL